MKRAGAFAAVGVASLATAQEWRFDLSNPVLSPGSPSTFVTLSIDHGPRDYAFGGANLSVSASEAGWSDLVGLLALGVPPFGGHPGQVPGSIFGPEVTGITVRQLGAFGWEPRRGRVDVWRATFTVTDFTARSIALSTETTRFEVYPDFPAPISLEPRTPIEGREAIRVVPAPAGVALLGVVGVLLAGRRRKAGDSR